MAANKEMSEWIKFFTSAGIPPGPAAKYAVVFLDNRIGKSMLMDLTKEYLKEMGISIMGDVIAILKYAKTAHVRYENEKPAITALKTDPDAKVELKRQTTPGNRMLEHYMRKEGIMEGGSPKVTVSPSMAVRLGAVPVGAGGKKGSSSAGLAEAAEVVPVKRPRMVKPEEEGGYIISMPKGSTPRTQKILEQKQRPQPDVGAEDKKSSVFARLGAGSSPAAAKQPAAMKATTTPPQLLGGESNVFKRLGGQRKRVVSDSSDSAAEYQGILKSLSSQTSPASAAATKVKKPATVNVTVGASKLASLTPQAKVQTRLGGQNVSYTAGASPTTAGASVKKSTLMARLGAPVTSGGKAVASPSSNASPQKVVVTIGGGSKKAAVGAPRQGVMDRLGVQRPEVSTTTTTHMDAMGYRSKVQSRLGGGGDSAPTPTTTPKGALRVAAGNPSVKKSLQARLGMQTKAAAISTAPKAPSTRQMVTVTLGRKPTAIQNRLNSSPPGVSKNVTMKSTASGKMLKRLGSPVGVSGVPTKASAVQDRLGLMRAEATSTTPSFTVTMGAGVGGGAGGGRAKKSHVTGLSSKQGVFSRLGAS